VKNVEVGSQVSGIIDKINVDFNSHVKEGDVIAQIDPSTYQQALVQAEAAPEPTLLAFNEPLAADLGLDRDTGRVVCSVRGGRARAVLSRTAHQALLDHVEQEGSDFFVVVGPRRVPFST
jgi:multidrug efflux pump subunit AcrA (membrane-fusion protein)